MSGTSDAARMPGAEEEHPADGPWRSVSPSPHPQQQQVEDSPYMGVFGLESLPVWRLFQQMQERHEGDPDMAQTLKTLEAGIRTMYERIQAGVQAERDLLKKNKTLQSDLSRQRLDIGRTGNKQFLDTTDINELRRESLKAANELKSAKAKERAVLEEIEENRRIRQSLLKDIEEIRRHKADMIEPQLITATKELRLEVGQKKHQVQELVKDLEEKEATYDLVNAERTRLSVVRDKQAAVLTKSAEVPVKVAKQMDVLRDAITSLGTEGSKQDALNGQLDVDLKHLVGNKKVLEDHKTALITEFERNRGYTEDLETRCAALYKEQEMYKELLSHFKVEKVKVEMAMRRVVHETKKDHDAFMRAIKEKEALIKTHHNLQTSVDNIQMTTPGLRKTHEDLGRQLDLLRNEQRLLTRKMRETKKAVDMAMFAYVRDQGLSSEHERQLEEQRKHVERLDQELDVMMAKVNETHKTMHETQLDKEVKLRELKRSEAKYKAIQEEKHTKQIWITDSIKRAAEATAHLKEFTSLYDVVKNERNKYLNQIQASNQRSQEMKEKVKILSNELEILRKDIAVKEREIVKRRQENHAQASIREGVRNEANTLLLQYKTKRRQIDAHLTIIEGMNSSINATEVEMMRLKGEYERIIKERNVLGVNLLDRNDELCILYEKLNIQKEVMAKGELALKQREEEVHKLRLLIAELDRKLLIQRNTSSTAHEYEERVATASKELKALKRVVNQLGDLMEDPEGPDRSRNLPGRDPTHDELLHKIRQVEGMLAVREEKVLEKDLVLEEVETLTTRLKQQCAEGRAESQQVTALLNDYTKRVKNLSRSMMAKVSELSMNQASAMALYQEKCEKEALLENARERLAKGDIPEDVEREFLRAERVKVRRAQERAARQGGGGPDGGSGLAGGEAAFRDPENEGFFFHNGTHTTAEPRPNAYIPNSNMLTDLPVPKPFGAFAPFKAGVSGDAGATTTAPVARFYRKPVIKPIEI